MASKKTSCGICEAVDKAMFLEQDFPVHLGRVRDLRHRAPSCSSCMQICGLIKAIDPLKWENEIVLLKLHQSDHSSSEFLISLSNSGRASIAPGSTLRLLQESASGVLVHSLFVDIDKIRRWLRHCDEQHAGNCHNLAAWQTIVPPENLLLIDVRRKCLVEMPGTIRYCALSYVWGQLLDTLETRQENIGLLKQNGSLASTNHNSVLPETIRDAVRLVQCLGQRYLWVDRLCIIQNDDENKRLNIMRMDSIYSNAYLTIIAADGPNANYGLPGMVDGFRPRSGKQHIINFPRGTLVSEIFDRKGPYGGNVGTIYHRGWAFQERCLSPRTLVFSQNSIHWRCQVSLWDEDVRGIPEGVEYSHREPVMVLPFIQWPDMRMWAQLVRDYNTTDLTFPGDAQAAFSGIENVLQRSFPSGLFCGLPEFYFDWALLWQANPHAERRMAINNLTGHIFPSWSWLGWKGDIVLEHCNFLCEEYWKDSNLPYWKREDYSCQLEPLVRWIHVGSSSGEEREIQCNWHGLEKWTGNNQESARNWTLRQAGGENWYENETADGVLFRHPFPWTQQRPPSEEQSRWPPYLRLRSSTAPFIITNFCELYPNSGESGPENRIKNRVIISDKRGQVAGTLRLDRTPENRQTPIGRECELLVISRGRATLSDPNSGAEFKELYEEQIRKCEDVFEFYNVLYVQWEEEGHMVREGIGRVEKSIWEQQELKDVDAELH